jgi:aryl-alcohol dehydrogenase-like predicted oxidoreductase
MSTTLEFKLGGDLAINRLGFGAMRLPRADWQGPPRDPAMGRAVLRRAVELGVDHIDTADFYMSGKGEVRASVLIREALAPYPPGLVIATKVGPLFGPNREIIPAPASEMRRLVEDNLERLGLDRLDLVYLRIGGMTVPHGESLADRFEALARLREEGLIRHLGVSNIDADHLAEARAIAPVAAVQNNFHIAKRADMAVLKACEQGGIAFIPFGPIGGGRNEIGDDRLARIAGRHGATSSQMVLAWLLALSPIALAIPGTGSLAHLEENMASAKIALTPQELADLAA